MIVTAFILVYLTYPSVTNLSFSLFNCYTLDDGKSYLRRDFNVECWTKEHYRMALAIGLPFIIIWVVCFPAYIFYHLIHIRSRFGEKQIITKYGLFFVGLSDDAFFWEIIVSNSRKIIFIICSTLL